MCAGRRSRAPEVTPDVTPAFSASPGLAALYRPGRPLPCTLHRPCTLYAPLRGLNPPVPHRLLPPYPIAFGCPLYTLLPLTTPCTLDCPYVHLTAPQYT